MKKLLILLTAFAVIGCSDRWEVVEVFEE